MTNLTIAYMQEALATLKTSRQYRHLPILESQGSYVLHKGKKLLNIASNDYLGLACDSELQTLFLNQTIERPDHKLPRMSATSSRLLTGNDEQLQALETDLQQWYQTAVRTYKDRLISSAVLPKSALVINSGYHANIGILAALTALPVKTLMVADKLVHASIIDGMRLSQSKLCTYRRYRHNDYEHLAHMIAQADEDTKRIIIITESIFSMDGDRADLQKLVQLKALDSRIELYIDEAHAIGVLGNQGLGLAEETQTLTDIDYLVGTFGKAFASVGAYILCDDVVKQWLVNYMRPLIFSTALPPINHAWTRFILARIPQLNDRREHLATLSLQLRQAIQPQYRVSSISQITYDPPIVPYVLGDNERTIDQARKLQDAGFYALPIRPPTVPENTARIRLVMNAALTISDCQKLIEHL